LERTGWVDHLQKFKAKTDLLPLAAPVCDNEPVLHLSQGRNRQAGSSSAPTDTREFEQEFSSADDISVTSRHVGEGSDAHSIEQESYADEGPVNLHYHCTEDPEAETEP
jgi:hypothetical protein